MVRADILAVRRAGVACHECGHAFGCWLCGEKVTEFVPFMLNDPERLGYVRHTLSGGWKGAIANLVIGTGPIWFGCSILALLAVNFVPSAGRLVSVAVYLALPTLFTVHALMLFAALANAVRWR